MITPKPIVEDCGLLGPFCRLTQATDAAEAFKAFATVISNVIGVLTVVAGLWFGFQLIIGAYAWMSSGGDKAQLEGARNRITHAFLGLIIVVASIAVIGVFGKFLGWNILDFSKLSCQLDPRKDPSQKCP